MRVVVPGFEHHPGLHCASTALADALRLQGIRLSEEAVLGLGSGAAFVLFEGPGLSPAHFLMGRSLTFEQDACRTLGVRFDEQAVADFDDAWRQMRAHLDAGRVVLALTDLKYLPHYATQTHFNGHRLLLAGYDDAQGTVLLADSHFPGLQEVPLSAWRAALVSDFPPFTTSDCVFGVLDPPAQPIDPRALARIAIRRAAEEMLSGEGASGVAGIERLARTLPRWSEDADWKWSARFAYQVIEKRGCGGGLFRRMYARFLDEAASDWGLASCAPLAEKARAAADRWSLLAAELKAASERDRPDFQAAAERAGEVAAAERALWTAAAAEGRAL